MFTELLCDQEAGRTQDAPCRGARQIGYHATLGRTRNIIMKSGYLPLFDENTPEIHGRHSLFMLPTTDFEVCIPAINGELEVGKVSAIPGGTI